DSSQLTASVNDSRQILPSLPLVRIMYIMLNASGHFKRRVKTAGFVHIKKLLDHKFDPFPAVTLREFC
ncbi:hypothetical protein NA357_11830, partial [Salmonella sp. NW68]|uniref:hypothetical protein n=1 Tax=Salmonella sp. NW68 TaxID=2948194 RepID=UPI003F43240F